MATGQSGGGGSLRRVALAGLSSWVCLLLVGCAPIVKLKSRVLVEPAAANGQIARPITGTANISPLASIVNHQLQRGRYRAGEKELRTYLAQRPGDRTAQDLLEQLTGDPMQMLGRASTPYVVKQGDSYSSLAQRYLGDATRFLVLARYNGSTNPSKLQVGESLRLPVSAPVATPDRGAAAGVSTSHSASDSASPPVAASSVVRDPSAVKAAKLQQESIDLRQQGQLAQALSRLDQALTLDPQLKPSGPASEALRRELVTQDHQQAIVLYRDQHLDQAIALWDRVLVIDPEFEPAKIYRARAIELKRRLKQL
jgi:tetratricopeptide (TPR) repeat protein